MAYLILFKETFFPKSHPTILILVLIFLFHNNSFGQHSGYWNNHIGIEGGATYLKFDNPQYIIPSGGEASPGYSNSIFIDCIRVKETPSKNTPIWGIKLKFTWQSIVLKGNDEVNYSAHVFSVPLVLKLRLFGSGGYWDLNKENASFYPIYHKKNKCDVYLFAGAQYNYTYNIKNFTSVFKTSTDANIVYSGEYAGIGGLEINFESLYIDFSYQKNIQNIFYNNKPINLSGFTVHLGLPFGNVYKNYH